MKTSNVSYNNVTVTPAWRRSVGFGVPVGEGKGSFPFVPENAVMDWDQPSP